MYFLSASATRCLSDGATRNTDMPNDCREKHCIEPQSATTYLTGGGIGAYFDASTTLKVAFFIASCLSLATKTNMSFRVA
ncbi:hypothetical protein LAUMK7_04409 [Mycobacterium kansasii]|nr:hypothetical protein LAUMK22_03783 [Mycobacterium kansasii]VAZ68397.1 hypothetical protein LAUMK40_04549 [Mycobacterium kansasii]VAZ78599.1 hypothetical protein LAUMK7_04409 [Mycobacterium kansasii]